MADLHNLIGNLSPEKRALLERRLLEKRAAAAKSQVIPRRQGDGPCPLSFAQELMWLLDQLIDTSAYHVPRALRIKGPLNVEALEYALNAILARHDILRTTYREVNGTPWQFVADIGKVNFERVDLSHLELRQREKEATRILEQQGRHNFDLANDLMFRALLLRMGEQDHVLLLLSHHIASDGQSKAALFRELKVFYLAYCAGVPPQLPELPIQYADYAVWQREWLQGEVLEKHLLYWKTQLAGAPMLLEIPTDRPRPARQSFEGARQFVQCPQGTLESFKALCRGEGTTMFMTMLAAFATLLYRWSGQEDMLIGTPVSGRSRTELEPLIGYFSNSVVLRLALGGDPTFRELMRRLKEVSLAAYSHQDLPFEKLVVEMQPQRDLSYSPLYQVMFSVGEQKDLGLDLPGLEITPIIIDRKIAKFDMTLGMTEFRNALMCNIEYCSALFDAGTMERLACHFQNLLQGIMENPDRRVSELPMLSDAERRQFIFQWNDTARNYQGNRLVHQLFEQEAAAHPDATALVYANQTLTYAQLNARANQLAHFLLKRGIGPDVPVVICLDRCLEMIVGVLGILKAGGTYVPLDAAYARERLPAILEDTKAPVLITHSTVVGQLPDPPPEVVLLDAHWPAIAQGHSENPDGKGGSSSLAYIVYTSGSTGLPKGVMVSHGSLLNAYHAWDDEYQLRSQSSSHLQMANFSFDVFSGDLVRALCSGKKLVICPTELLLDPSALYSLMLAEKIDCAEFVPAVLRGVVSHLKQTAQKLDFMRLLIAGSDTWTVAEYSTVLDLCGAQTRLINSYGVAEATIDTTYFETRTGRGLRGEGFVPIGRPFPNMQVYILDRHLHPCPIGVTGTLYIAGSGLARGYLNRPELTAEKFISSPFSHNANERLYNTGDQARYLPDGNIEFLGRTDSQVKIRGFRVELGEIEAAITKYPGVRQAVVVPRQMSPDDLRLVAYAVAEVSQQLKVSELRKFLKDKLPAYMLPTSFVMIEAFPLNANGKIDRKALPVPDNKSSDVGEDFVAPRTDDEQKLAAIWADVLQVSSIGVQDNFFALGGHSLMAIQVISRVRNQFAIELPLRTLFENPTIAELAVAMRVGRHEAISLALPTVPIKRNSVRVKRTQA
ncbi:MAG TPA: amino acid adenylation domain-containing protein [Terriglobales bacterium]